jgi:hypothetical protein
MSDGGIGQIKGDKFYGCMALLEVTDLVNYSEKDLSLVYVNQIFGIIYRTADRYLADSHFICNNKFIIV